MIHDKPIGGIAAPSVARVLAPTIADAKREAKSGDRYVSLGMLMGWKRAGKDLCLSIDTFGSYLFTVDTSSGVQRLSAVKDLGAAGCDG